MIATDRSGSGGARQAPGPPDSVGAKPATPASGVPPDPPHVPIRDIIRRFLPDVRVHAWGIAGMLALSIISPALETLGVWLFKVLIDRVLVPQDFRPLGWMSLLFLGIALVDGVASYYDRILSTTVTERFILKLRTRVFRHLLASPIDFLERRRLGDLMTRLSGDVSGIETLLLSGFVGVFSNLARVLFFGTAVFLLEWRLAIVSFCALPFFYLAVRRFSGRIREASRRARRQSGLVTSVGEEGLSSVAMVQAYGREDDEALRMRHEGLLGIDAQLVSARLRGVYSFLVDLIQLAGGLSVVALGTWGLSTGRLTLGGVLVFVTYLGKLYGPLRSLTGFINTAHSSAASAERVIEILELRPTPEDRPGARPLAQPAGIVEFHDVHFRYPGAEREVLSGLSFRVEPGEIIAIVGPSGSGKSTIAKLLLRFYDPTSGRITFDGNDTRELTAVSLREAMALVLQETVLMHASVRENIAYGRTDATEAEIVSAARAADAEEFIAQLSDGYDTPVGQKGRRLSGGQRQRIAIARAIVRNAPVLILDEPTTGLDNESAHRVLEPLRRAMTGRATVLISHDLFAVAGASRVIFLEDGRVLESGTHAELIALDGRYAALYRTQMARLHGSTGAKG